MVRGLAKQVYSMKAYSMKAKPLRLLTAVITLLFGALISSPAHAADMKRMLRFAPQDSQAIVGADIDRLRAWKHFGTLIDSAIRETGGQSALRKAELALDINIRKDVRGFVVAFGPTFAQDDDQFVIMMQAPVNEQSTVAFIKQEGAKVTRQQGLGGHFYDIDGDAGLAFRGDIVILGGAKTFRKAMTGGGGALPRLRSRVDSGELFVAARVPTELQQKLAREMPELGDLKNVVASLSVNGGQRLVFDSTFDFSNAHSPRMLADEFNKQLRQLSGEQFIRDLGLAKFLSRPDIKAVGNELRIEMRLRGRDLDQIFKALRP